MYVVSSNNRMHIPYSSKFPWSKIVVIFVKILFTIFFVFSKTCALFTGILSVAKSSTVLPDPEQGPLSKIILLSTIEAVNKSVEEVGDVHLKSRSVITLATTREPTPTGIQHKSFRIPNRIWNLDEESEILCEMKS